ncbi:hypothetical protein [Virgibacillus sp. YIM 98842]|uniref:hypothetical protein n=1 Tax=Virgibacillus sp. YIM 98842 TaxID=2663533 RepID=UPI0013D8FB29|nr:hypothetical protein [Virgibacillus sp. YIM 98842]
MIIEFLMPFYMKYMILAKNQPHCNFDPVFRNKKLLYLFFLLLDKRFTCVNRYVAKILVQKGADESANNHKGDDKKMIIKGVEKEFVFTYH